MSDVGPKDGEGVTEKPKPPHGCIGVPMILPDRIVGVGERRQPCAPVWCCVIKDPEDGTIRALVLQKGLGWVEAYPDDSDIYQAALAQVIKRTSETLRAVAMNDKTTYEHHEVRRRDGAPPEPNGGTIWLTPRELALSTLKQFGDETESLYAPFRMPDGSRTK